MFSYLKVIEAQISIKRLRLIRIVIHLEVILLIYRKLQCQIYTIIIGTDNRTFTDSNNDDDKRLRKEQTSQNLWQVLFHRALSGDKARWRANIKKLFF